MARKRPRFSIMEVETSRDDRGWVSNLLDFLPVPPERVKNVHICEMKIGCVRGNHRHRRQTEWIVLCGGPYRVLFESDGVTIEEHIMGERPTMLTVLPGTAHAIRFEGEGLGVLISVTDQPYDFATPDVEKVELLQ